MCDSSDQRQNIDQYFVERNGVKFSPVEDRNYTNDSLAVMQKGDLYDKLADSITRLGVDIIEVNPGIGGLSFALLDWYKTRQVSLYESNRIYQDILRNNLEAYKFPRNKYQLFNEFRTVPVSSRNVILVINLQRDCRDSFPNYPVILKRNQTKVKSVVVISNDPEKLVSNVEGYACVSKAVGDLNIQICQPIRKEILEVDVEKIPETNPRYEQAIFFQNPSKWQEELRSFIRNLLSIITKNEKILEGLTSDKAMEVWTRAFTSDLWNPKPEANYQILEYYGDTVMKITFDAFLLKENPELDEAQATSLRIAYVSKIVQGAISNKLDLPKHIRSPIEVSTSVAEDLLEAFFGALMTVGDTVFKQGMGYGLAYNFTKYLYTSIYPVDISKGVDPNKTQVKNIYNRLEWGKDPGDFEVYEQSEDQWTLTLKWPAAARSFVRDKGISSDILVVSSNNRTVKAAESRAYQMAIDRLSQLGITTEFSIREQKRRQERGQSQFSELYRQGLTQAVAQGYTDFEFEWPIPSADKKRPRRYVQMQGRLPDGDLIPLVTLPIDTSLTFRNNKEYQEYWKSYALGYYIKYGSQEYPQ